MIEQDQSVFAPFRGKSVLFITTKNTDYIRNTQEIEALSVTAGSVTILGYAYKSYVKRLMLIFLRLLFMPMRPYDAVFVGFAPQLILPFFRWRFKAKLIGEDFFISLYDTLVNDRKKFQPGSVFARILRHYDKITLDRAGFIVADTQAHANFFVREFGADPQRMHVLYLEADRSIYYPRKAQAKSSQSEKKAFTVLYFGSILPLQGTEVLLECVQLMRDNTEISFEIIGPVREAEKERCKDCNVSFTPWLSQKELAERIAVADLCLAGHFNAQIGKAARTIPGKAYIYEAMEKPMILGENPANHELFSEDGTHFFVKMGDAAALKEIILLASNRLKNGQ